MKKSDGLITVLCVLGTTLTFSTMELVSKQIPDSYNALGVTLIRFAIGTLILLPFGISEIRKKKLKLGLRDYLYFLIAGILGVTLSMSLFQMALQNTTASMVAVIFSVNPVFTAVFARFMTKERLTPKKLAAILISVAGVLFIFNPFAIAPDIYGMLLALLSAVAFSLYTVLSRRRIMKYGAIALSSFSFAAGTVALLVFTLVTKTPIIGGLTIHSLPHILYLGLIVTGLGYFCYFMAIKHSSAVSASMAFLIKPALATLLSFFILHDNLSWNAWVGVGLIIAASVVSLGENLSQLSKARERLHQ